MAKKILMVAGDIGQGNMIKLIGKELIQKGCEVAYVLDAKGKAKDVFKKEGIEFSEALPRSPADLIVCAVSATAGGLEYEASRFANVNDVPLIFVEDFFLNVLGRTDELHIRPDSVLVPHEGAAEILRELSWPLSKSRIVVTGHPALDSIREKIPQKNEIRKKIRRKLRLDLNELFVVLWLPGKPEDAILETIAALNFTLKSAASRGYISIALAIRPHPKDEINVQYPYEIFLGGEPSPCNWNGHIVAIDGGNEVIQDDLNLAADLAVTCWSTEGFKAVAAGVPTIFYLLPSAQKELSSRGIKRPYVPFIKNGEAIGVFTWKEALGALDKALALKDKLRPVTSDYKPAAERAAEAIINILK